jgi:two-component system response regulator WspF
MRTDPADVLLLELTLPRMDGVEATRRIMAERPCPILIVTATVCGRIDRVYEAMGQGAVDAIDTPVARPNGVIVGAELLLAKVRMVGKLIGKQLASVRAAAPQPPLPLVLIGASTGGPSAVKEILNALPADARLGAVLVQHIDAGFACGLAAWLSERSPLPVELVTPGQRPLPGKALLAGTNDHLIMDADRRLRYTAEPRNACFRPSVDVLFHSVAEHWPQPGVAVLLTGMQRDGAEGLLRLRQRGWHTIAQDRATSVVWGMPEAAVQLGAAVEVLPLPRIAAAIAEQARRQQAGE